MPTCVLTQRESNRALLARQMLLERSPALVSETVERPAGPQAQMSNAPYIGLWTRLRDAARRGCHSETWIVSRPVAPLGYTLAVAGSCGWPEPSITRAVRAWEPCASGSVMRHWTHV